MTVLGAGGTEEPDKRLEVALLVAAARSGSTLLRLMLDVHPEIGCPAEAGIPSLIQTLGRVWWTVDADLDPVRPAQSHAMAQLGPRPQPDEQIASASALGGLLPEAEDAIRHAALAPMRHYCERRGKRLYCDKSLDSVHHLEAVRQIFPEARYLLLFRHVLDTVVSGIEASPWGFQAYGYFPFVQRSPDNLVVALVSYWLEHVENALRWEESHPELCHRLRYEDLVTAPEDVLAQLFGFLRVDRDFSVLRAAFQKARTVRGAGDYKVTFTSGLDTSSIGRGKRVPVEMIPPPLLEAVNTKLTALGYDSLSKGWNAEPLVNLDAVDVWGSRLAEWMRRATVAPRSNGDGGGLSFALVAQDVESLRWVIDTAAGTVRQGDGEVETVVTGTAEDLTRMLTGEANPGVLLISGRVRHLTAHEGVSLDELMHTTLSILDALRTNSTGAAAPS